MPAMRPTVRDEHAIETLNNRFGVPGLVKFDSGGGGMARTVVTTPHGEAHVYRYGAHVTHYMPAGQPPVLLLSEKSHFTHGRPIRGGVPIVFPWFGPRANDPQAPLHGLVRVRDWDVESVDRTPDGESVAVTLMLRSSDETFAIWPHDFVLRYTVTVGRQLELALEVANAGGEEMTFEEGLHTYFAVADVTKASVHGLQNKTYLDKTRKMEQLCDSGSAVTITELTDRVYHGTSGTCTIDDPAGNRRIVVERSGSNSTVIWNPTANPPAPIADLGPDEWRKFICVETANVMEHAVTLAHGQRHVMRAVIRSEPR
jgi:glucose-6-phosphate 1-epimerase